MPYHKSSSLPSVTQVLAPWTDYSRIPEHVLANASERGSRVHAVCAARIQGLWHPPVGEDIAGYVQSFDDWARLAVDGVLLVEPELVDDRIGYCGHIDLVCTIRGDDEGATVVDLKTPQALGFTWRAQLAAYRNLATVNGFNVTRVVSLRLAKDGGRARLDEYTGTAGPDFAGFLSALNAWRYFNSGAKS